MTMKQCLIGIQCNDFTMVAADQMNSPGILIMKNDEDKLYQLSDRLILGMNGSPGDMLQFSNFVASNLQLYKFRNGYELDTAAVAHFTRKSLADALIAGTPYLVNLLVAGYDDGQGGQLYILDVLGACVKVPFAAHDIGGMLSLSILADHYKPTLTEAQAYNIMKMCVKEINARLILKLPNFEVKVVSAQGVKRMTAITPATIGDGYK